MVFPAPQVAPSSFLHSVPPFIPSFTYWMPSQHTHTKLSRSLSLLSTTQAAHILILFGAHTCMHNSSQRKTLFARSSIAQEIIINRFTKVPKQQYGGAIFSSSCTHTVQYLTTTKTYYTFGSESEFFFLLLLSHYTMFPCSNMAANKMWCDAMRCSSTAHLTAAIN